MAANPPPQDPLPNAPPTALLDPPYSYVAYGGDTNCTLEICPVILSVYQYRPSVPANAVFIALFGLSMVVHLVQAFLWKTWTFGILMAIGCLTEILGYAGRIILYNDPFSFSGFLLQIICITIAPVFYTAAIYITLAKIVNYLGPQYARFPSKFYYWVFIPCDIISLVLQALGGALSSTSSGSSNYAVDISLAGLSFQVFTLCVFITLSLEFAFRYRKSTQGARSTTMPFKLFIFFLSFAIILILIRCAYRIDELSDGYNGSLIHDEGLFIGLEGVMIIVSAFFLNIGHPGIVKELGAVKASGAEEKEEA